MSFGDKIWILYRKRISSKDNRPSTVTKPGLHQEESSFIRFVGLERCSLLLPQGETINSAKYSNQFDKLKAAIAEKRPELANRRGCRFSSRQCKTVCCVTCERKVSDYYSLLKNSFRDKQFQSVNKNAPRWIFCK